MISSLLLTAALLTPLAPGGEPKVGDEAPEISAKSWLNNIGIAPSLESFRGQAVLLEFWATW
jgi:hypothetical protein